MIERYKVLPQNRENFNTVKIILILPLIFPLGK